nr:putative ribonuclease H-like domain-containing protein [Tanacetum cinerariifolium]
MDVKSAFLYVTIEEEVYVCQPPGFEDPKNPNKVYKVVKALYGLHQAPRAWYETLATYLLENRFQRGTIDQTLFIKKQQKDILLVQIYVDDIIFGATNKALCQSFKKLMKDKFQMCSMGELAFFLGLQFWNSVLVKRSGDVTRLQALVDKKKIVISDAVIREILQLNDAEGVVCLPNKEIFAGLAQMGVGKGFSGVKTPLFEGMIADRQLAEEELGAEQGMKYDEILPIFRAKFDANMRFLFKSREEMEKEDQEIIKSINETPAQKAAKRRKLKDLETLWIIVKDRFSTSKPANFSDEYLLLTLRTMFEEPDGQDAIWRNQKSVHGLALVKRWKLLTSCSVHVITLSTV